MNKLNVNIGKFNINYFIFYYCKIILIIVFVIQPYKIILFYNVLEQTTFTNKKSAMYCKL